MSPREVARRLMGYFVVPQPAREKNLHVYLGGKLPDHGIRCPCPLVAKRYWRVAHEQSCTRIVVHRGPSHKHAFDTVDLMRSHARTLGWWPARPERFGGKVPRFRATRTVQATGDTLEAFRPVYAVPAALASTPVSGRPQREGD